MSTTAGNVGNVRVDDELAQAVQRHVRQRRSCAEVRLRRGGALARRTAMSSSRSPSASRPARSRAASSRSWAAAIRAARPSTTWCSAIIAPTPCTSTSRARRRYERDVEDVARRARCRGQGRRQLAARPPRRHRPRVGSVRRGTAVRVRALRPPNPDPPNTALFRHAPAGMADASPPSCPSRYVDALRGRGRV